MEAQGDWEMSDKDRLEMALRLVRELEKIVERQKEIIAKLRKDRYPTKQAEDLLATFEATLATQRDELRCLGDTDQLITPKAKRAEAPSGLCGGQGR